MDDIKLMFNNTAGAKMFSFGNVFVASHCLWLFHPLPVFPPLIFLDYLEVMIEFVRFIVI